ncbi:5828_t:CDS:2, partial [Racocetra persica]
DDEETSQDDIKAHEQPLSKERKRRRTLENTNKENAPKKTKKDEKIVANTIRIVESDENDDKKQRLKKLSNSCEFYFYLSLSRQIQLPTCSGTPVTKQRGRNLPERPKFLRSGQLTFFRSVSVNFCSSTFCVESSEYWSHGGCWSLFM